jgi:hypothetical protein
MFYYFKRFFTKGKACMEGIMVIICSLHSESALNGVPYCEPKALTILIHKAWRNFPLNLEGTLYL